MNATSSLDRAPGSATQLWAYALLAFVATAGFFYINIMAAIVDGLVTDWHFSNAQAGSVAAANIYGASAGALIAALTVRRLRWRPTLALLLVALLLVDLASILVHEPTWLIVVRAAHGVVGGMAVGVSYSVMARTASSDRAFGMLLLVQFGLAGLGLMVLPPLVPEYGARILFLALAGFSALALLALPAIPHFDDAAATPGEPQRGIAPAARRSAAFALLAMFLFQAGNMALSAFIIGLGERFGLERGFVSHTLGWATWIGAAGAVLVIAMGTPKNRLRPLLAAMLLTLAGTAAFFGSGNAPVFFLANVGTAITWSFVVPCLFGMVSQLDRSGRLATVAGFVSKMGLASGPLLAGWVLRAGGDHALITAAIALLACSAVAALAGAHRLDRKETATS
ncbi:MFS transporter [Tahibacter sp. UC22_41]|uniref:MFS transporter n=1 Tax=Tahibacter sp. UC22_41 TaxID=3350178 RepID=UPI0036D7E233